MNGIGRSSSEFRNAAAADTAATAEADEDDNDAGTAAPPSASAALEFIMAAMEKFVALADLAGGSFCGGDPKGGTPAGRGKGRPAPKGRRVGVAWNKGRMRAGGGPPAGGGAEDNFGDIILFVYSESSHLNLCGILRHWCCSLW